MGFDVIPPTSGIDHPNEDIAATVGDKLIVLTVSINSLQSLREIETKHSIEPSVVITTIDGGEMHLLRRSPGASAASSSQLTSQHIQVAVDSDVVSLPPSGGAKIVRMDATRWDEFAPVTQSFMDEVIRCSSSGSQGPPAAATVDVVAAMPKAEINHTQNENRETPTTDEKIRPERAVNVFDKYALGNVDELSQTVEQQKPLLGNIVRTRQATHLLAAPGTGKSLLGMGLAIEAIEQGRIDPRTIYWLNADDDFAGLMEKAKLAELHGFHMLGDGFNGFSVKRFAQDIEELIKANQAADMVLFVDTLKRFFDPMSKAESRYFTGIFRRFVLKGGTLVGFGHVNKHLGANGKPVPSGVSDLLDDSDALYVMHVVDPPPRPNEKTVLFECRKSRGPAAQRAAYSYADYEGISYHDRLLSIKEVDPRQLDALVCVEDRKTDEQVIKAIAECIQTGITNKIDLAKAAAKKAGCSRGAALGVIEKYTGDDTTRHRWDFTVQAKGAKVFALLNPPALIAATGEGAP
jgi:hypothetical protein